MDRADALRDLLAAVEAGYIDALPDNCFRHAFAGMKTAGIGFNFSEAFEGSLDAAQALHEAVLSEDHQWVIGSFRDGRRFVTFDGTIEASNPARAWLLAILRALIAKEKSDDL